MKIENIQSSQNPKIKLIHKLYTSKGREKNKLFIAEGCREISMAYQSDFKIRHIFINKHFLKKKDLENFPFKDEVFYLVEETLFSKISYREDTEGIIAIFETKEHKLNQIQLSENPFLIVVESIQKPGNLGAILRTADATRADAVLVCNNVIDLYNPNVIRASIGCFFNIPIAVCSNDEAIEWLKANDIKIYCAALQNAEDYYTFNYSNPTAIVFGTEAIGLSNIWRQNADAIIKIPMLGKIDSLNVSNSVAIISYEVLRQRKFYVKY